MILRPASSRPERDADEYMNLSRIFTSLAELVGFSVLLAHVCLTMAQLALVLYTMDDSRKPYRGNCAIDAGVTLYPHSQSPRHSHLAKI